MNLQIISTTTTTVLFQLFLLNALCVATSAFMQRRASQPFCSPLMTVLVYFALKVLASYKFRLGEECKLKNVVSSQWFSVTA